MRTRVIADWFLWADHQSVRPSVTNMKLQKLVYLAESCYGDLTGGALVDDPIQAWDHGPVVKPLYGMLKRNGSAVIDGPDREPELPEEVRDVLETIWDYFGGMTAAALRNLTHTVGPYINHFHDDARDTILPADEIHDAWPEFLASATETQQPSGPARARLQRIASDARTEPAEDVNVDQLLADYHAFART